MTESASETRTPAQRAPYRGALALLGAALVLLPVAYGSLVYGSSMRSHSLFIACVSVGFLTTWLLFALRRPERASELWLWPAVGVVLIPLAITAYGLYRSENALVADAVGLAFFSGFGWIFLRWLLAEVSVANSAGEAWVDLLPGRTGKHTLPRGGLPLFLAIALLIFGLGAAVHRGNPQAPAPTLPLFGFAPLALIFLSLARYRRLETQARQSNLDLSPSVRSNWALTTLGFILVVVLCSHLLPKWYWRPKQGPVSRVGSARLPETQATPSGAPMSLPAPESPTPQPTPGESQTSGQNAQGSAPSAAAGALAALGQTPASLLWLLLMALFALFALLYWLNRRFRLVSRLRRMILSFVAFCRRLARKLRAWIKAKLNPPVPEPPSWQALSPAARSAALTDIFDDESLLAVLSPTEIMVLAFHQLLTFCERFGRGRRASQTPSEYARTLAPGDEGLGRFAWNYAKAIYSMEPVTREAVDDARTAWQRLRAAFTSPAANPRSEGNG